MRNHTHQILAFLLAMALLLTCTVAYFWESIDLSLFLNKHETTEGTVVDYTIVERGSHRHHATHYCLTINTQDGDMNYNVQYSVSKMDYDNIKVGDFVKVKDSWSPIGYNVIE